MDGVVADSCFEPAQRTIAFDPAWINRFLATDITSRQMQKILEKTGCKIIGENIVVPTFRPDLVHKADIAEEIARFYGYNQIASTALSGGAQGKYSETNLSQAKELGYTTVFWSLAYVDWLDDDQPTREEAFEKLLPRIHNGAVVLLHSTSTANAEFLDELLTKWEEMGYTFKPITELAGTK